MKNIKSKDIRSQILLCECSSTLLLIEEQLELLSAATLAGIHTLTHCRNIIPEAADMWQAGEHLNTVALCDRSLQGPQEIIQDHSPDTTARSAIAISLLTSLFNLLLTTQKLHSQQFVPMPLSPTIQKHMGMPYIYKWHYQQEKVDLYVPEFCIFTYYASWQKFLCQAKQPATRMPCLHLD